MPVQSISAEESTQQISEEFAEKLLTYVTYPNNAEEFAAMDEDEIVVYIDYYKITRGDLILQSDGTYMIDVSKITEDDYEGPSRFSRDVNVTYQTLGVNALGAAYKSASVIYESTYATGYKQTTKRRYVTTKQILDFFKEYPSTASAESAALSLWNIISAGITMSIPSGYLDLLKDISDFTSAFCSLNMRNAFRTYAAGSNGGYMDEIESTTSNGTTSSKTVGYGVWNQTTVEHRYDSGATSGISVATTIIKSTAG